MIVMIVSPDMINCPSASFNGLIGTDHNHIAMGKVQHLGNPVHHCISQSNDRIYAAKANTVDQIRNKTHKKHLFAILYIVKNYIINFLYYQEITL